MSSGFRSINSQNYLAGSSRAKRNRTNGNSIRVLVCSANMGNAEPNCESLSAWIPKDGDAKSVLEDQPYPLGEAVKNKFKLAATAILGTSKNDSISEEVETVHDDSDANKKFDIIAIGMQEATFEVSEETSHSKLTKFKRLQKMTAVVEQATLDKNYQDENATIKNIKNIRSQLASKRSIGFMQSTSSGPEKSTISACPLETSGEENKDDADPSQNDDTRLLHHMLQEHLPSYTRAVSYQRGQMRMIIFYNNNEIDLDVLSVKAQNTGRGGLANKGGIVAECDINSGTRISFLTAHLEAHEGISKYNTRCSTIGDILKGTVSGVADSYCDVSMTSHFTFVTGDLNFRTRLPDHEIGSDEHIEATHNLTENKDWKTLNRHDELSLALTNKECLVGFSTPRCDFPPTFKVERKDGYGYNPKRSPSYTDRILYKANHGLSKMISPQAYEPIDHFTTSDHKPIRGAFEIQLNSNLKWRPMLKKTHTSFRYFRKQKLSTFNPKTKKVSSVGCKSEHMYLFISSIECNIEQGPRLSSVYLPSPCVAFVSTPNEAITTEVVTLAMKWNTFYRKYRKSPIPVFQMDRGNLVKMKWPHTKPIPNTLNPKWEGEMNLKVRTHDEIGTPVDLTGAMLHIMVLDSRDNLSLVGSCTLNLASLIDASRYRKSVAAPSSIREPLADTKSNLAMSFAARLLGMSKSHKESSQSTISDGNSKNDIGTNVRNDEHSDPAFNITSSNPIFNIQEETVINTDIPNDPSTTVELSTENNPSSDLKKIQASSAFSSSVKGGLMSSFGSTRSDMVHSLQINEVLMKNGVENGTIKFNMDTWWLNDGEYDKLPKDWRGR